MILRSEHGTIVHTGDWKIDENPIDGQKFDREFFEAIGRARYFTKCLQRWITFFACIILKLETFPEQQKEVYSNSRVVLVLSAHRPKNNHLLECKFQAEMETPRQ